MTTDLHGDFIPFNIMEDYVKIINGNYKMRYLINHRRDIPPLGYFDNAEIKEVNKIFHVFAEPLVFKNRVTANFDKSLILEEPEKPISFITSENTDKFQILIDKNNFENINVLQNTAKKLRQVYSEEISLELGMRKNLVPDPQVVITLAKYYFILYPLLKPFFAKIGEKIAEDIAEDIYDGCKKNAKAAVKKLSETVRIVRQNMIPKDKILHTIFEIPGTPTIELHIKSDDATKIEKGLQATKLFSVHKKVTSLQSQVDISEIHFIFNSKNKWEFSYLITSDGKIIGTKLSFSKRDKLLSRIELSPTKAFSIGASGIEYERNFSRQI
ncbi:hypothetical protein NG800_014005 [Epilithonimonas ginsengisoli]|uniref:Uncharacterized protein n=1 Tax=Epilithonimonas ginsengisoli TaxID=1245592 RepID=A0ABU4JK05_9FLAO|nr:MULTISPECIES: hypothetical protein [Chryseobacterium group]MBV6880448.1 hypothetical protein [Epilithonimonas sp. FP105]MDW8550035.1 hypothetical protein [Epilithonimonas ginsengisoli]OAH69215.1 hypothetical protein AXA65_15435 [Chryseobacterium sp. FP211-J200]